MNLRLPQNDWPKVQGRTLFFDANVLISIFSPVGGHKPEAAAYASFLSLCVTNTFICAVDTHVLSEFINVWLRFEYNNYLKKQSLNSKSYNFKKYRNSSEGKLIAGNIEAVVKGSILPYFSLLGKLFTTTNLQKVTLPTNDFNDFIIESICKEHNCVLVTHDADFAPATVDILSANPKLATPTATAMP